MSDTIKDIETRKLKAKFTTEALEDLKALHPVPFPKDENELDKKDLKKLFAVALDNKNFDLIDFIVENEKGYYQYGIGQSIKDKNFEVYCHLLMNDLFARFEGIVKHYLSSTSLGSKYRDFMNKFETRRRKIKKEK